LVLVGMRGNFDGTRNRVIDGCSRGGGRRLCKENVGWIVDVNNFLASWSLRCDMLGMSAIDDTSIRHVVCTRVNDADGPLLNGFNLV